MLPTVDRILMPKALNEFLPALEKIAETYNDPEVFVHEGLDTLHQVAADAEWSENETLVIFVYALCCLFKEEKY